MHIEKDDAGDAMRFMVDLRGLVIVPSSLVEEAILA